MFKQIAFYKRKPGMTHEEFRDYYENMHVRVRLSSMKLPGLRRYMRRYLTPITDPVTGIQRYAGFDVVTELWFDDKAAWENYRKVSLDPEVRRIAGEDEDQFLDRDHIYHHLIDECDLTFPSEGPNY